MSLIGYKEKFVAFIDILGFKQLVRESEAGTGMPLPQILALVELFVKPSGKEGPKVPGVCPGAAYLEQDLDFRIFQFTDSAIISAEVSPSGIVNLLSHCTSVVVAFLFKGIMCRGYITRGLIHHTDSQVIGTGYQEALAGETGVTAFKREANERGTPFIEIDASVSSYAVTCSNDCVRQMYHRMVKSDGHISAIFPFDKLSHSFVLGGFGMQFDPEKERRANNSVRTIIRALQQRVLERIDQNNPAAILKGGHYLRFLDEQLKACDRADEVIDKLDRPFTFGQPRRQ